MALFLILFIIIFGVWANLYIFEMMTWQVLLSGMGLPWIGFSFGFVLAKLLKRPMEDIIAIAIETGIQNTGMSIFILWLTLDHPLGDMAGKLNTHFDCIHVLRDHPCIVYYVNKGTFWVGSEKVRKIADLI